jgi:hypothetical protein
MKTKIVVIIAVLLICIFNVSAQNVTDTVMIDGSSISQVQIGKFIPKSGSPTWNGSAYSVGRMYPTWDSSAVICRSYYTVSWSTLMPANSTINQVKVIYQTGGGGSYSFKITQISSTTGFEATWNAIASGSVKDQGIAYGSSSFISSNIKQAMQNAFATGYFYLGALSENETANDSYTSLTIALEVVYTHAARTVYLTAQNDLEGNNGGQIGVGVAASATSKPSPYYFPALEKQTINFQAYDNQQFGSYSSVFNDIEAPLNKSQWNKRVNGVEGPSLSSSQSYSYMANVSDNNGLFIAYLRKNLAISENDQTEFNGTQSAGIVGFIVKQNTGTITASSTKTIGGNNYVFAGWVDGEKSNPRTITPLDNQTYTGRYKVVHKSNNAVAFFNNSQRKIVQTPDYYLHQVYESMEHVWYEYSSNGGNTWTIGNQGCPLDVGGGKCPSIDYNGTNVAIVYQQPATSPYTYTIQLVPIILQNNIYQPYVNTPTTIYYESIDSYSIDANPSIAWDAGGDFIVTLEKKNSAAAGIYWLCGNLYTNPNPPPGVNAPLPYGVSPAVKLPNTTNNSIHCSVYKNKAGSTSSFALAYEQRNYSYSDTIKATDLYFYHNGSVWTQNNFPINVISSGTGPVNSSPSIIQYADACQKICWIRDLSAGAGDPYSVNVVAWDEHSSNQYNIYGLNTKSVSLNLRSNTNPYFVWSEYWNGSWANKLCNGSTFLPINTSGKDVQLTNGFIKQMNPYFSLNFMFASSYSTLALPYPFQTSYTVGSYLSKGTTVQGYGRGVGISQGDLYLEYIFGNLMVDKQSVEFVPAPDSLAYSTVDTINTVLISKPFILNKASQLTFNEYAGAVDSALTAKEMGSAGYIRFNAQIVEEGTGKVNGTMKEKKWNSKSLDKYAISSYRMTFSGTQGKTVRIKITMTTNLEKPVLSLLNLYTDADEMDKLSKATAPQELTLESDPATIITEYALEQNYPNPFNPSTTIRYQLPNAGHVMLKVYDMLGREVATLVDEMKGTGSYSATFDGARLASGTYIMRLTAESEEGKSFVETKKMMMLK